MILGPSALAIDASPALARLAPQAYEIAPGPIADALSRLADESGAHLVFDAALARHVFTRGVHGKRTLEEALEELLTGTKLGYRVDPDGRAVTIVLAQNDATVSDAEALPTIDVGAARALETRTGQGSGKPGTKDPTDYRVPESTSATKTDTPIREMPVSIQVVPYQVIADQKSYRVQDALENVSGVQPRGALGGYRERYIIRGFRGGSNFYRNGLRVSSSGLSSNFETGDVETIEVLKGGSSILYGRGEPSGSILFTTKLPDGAARYSIEQDVGFDAYYRTNLDIGAPLTADGSLAYRFSGAYTNTDTFRDFGQTQNYVLYPTLRWRPTEATDIYLGLEIANQTFYADFGIPALGNLPAPIPISRSLQDRNDPLDHQRAINLDFGFTHHFDESWSLTNRFLASFRHQNNSGINPYYSGLRDDGRTMDRMIGFESFDQTTYATNVDLKGAFDSWGVKHKVLVGVDYLNDSVHYVSGRKGGPYASLDPSLAVDIFAPVSLLPRSFLSIGPADTPSFFDDNGERWVGVYFQDQITLWDRLHILGGGRQDWVSLDNVNNDFFGFSKGRQHDSGFSPRVGLLFDIVPELGVYANWSETFGANNGRDANGLPLAPETGEQHEVGLKGRWLDGRVDSTLAFYEITKQNVSTRDLRFPNSFVQALIGEIRSRGTELDVAGRVSEGLDLIGSFALTDAHILVDGYGNQGHRVQGVPTTSGRLWLKYEFPSDSVLGGFGVGGGPYAVSNRAGDDANTFTLPGFVRLDAMVSYKTTIDNHLVTAQINMRNLTNQRYFESADTSYLGSPRFGITPGAPITVIGSLKVQF